MSDNPRFSPYKLWPKHDWQAGDSNCWPVCLLDVFLLNQWMEFKVIYIKTTQNFPLNPMVQCPTAPGCPLKRLGQRMIGKLGTWTIDLDICHMSISWTSRRNSKRFTSKQLRIFPWFQRHMFAKLGTRTANLDICQMCILWTSGQIQSDLHQNCSEFSTESNGTMSDNPRLSPSKPWSTHVWQAGDLNRWPWPLPDVYLLNQWTEFKMFFIKTAENFPLNPMVQCRQP